LLEAAWERQLLLFVEQMQAPAQNGQLLFDIAR
jgi:hypothetical protein